MNKKWYILILLVVVLVAILASSVIAAWLESNTAQNSGTADNPPLPPQAIDVYYDGVNWTDGDTLDWGTWQVGANTKNLTVVNTYDDIIRVIYTTVDLPTDWTASWTANNTLIAIGEATSGTLTVTCPTTIINEQTYTFNGTVTASDS